MEEYLNNYGYLALVIGILIEGEVMLLVASYAAHRGFISLPYVILISFFVTNLLDWGYFFLGRSKGTKFLANKPSFTNKTYKVYTWLERNPYLTLLSFRFIYGFRVIIPIILGSTNIKTSKFIIYSSISTFFWALIYGLMGFYLGKVLNLYVVNIKEYEKFILLILVISGIFYGLYRVFFKKKEEII